LALYAQVAMILSPKQQPDPVDILVADPDSDARQCYRDALIQVGERLVEAVDGREALVKALVKPPSLVITELELPFIDGAALCKILRQDRTTSRIPIVVVTRVNVATRIERARSAGANVVLLKPAPFAAIRLEMQRLLVDAQDVRRRFEAAYAKSASEVDRAARLLARADALLPKTLSKAHHRFSTTTPPTPPPALSCPICDQPLTYQSSHVGGVSVLHAEQWDYYSCGKCGPFQFRHRTRKLRHIAGF
jgi:CheY-like chemotaxis protein